MEDEQTRFESWVGSGSEVGLRGQEDQGGGDYFLLSEFIWLLIKKMNIYIEQSIWLAFRRLALSQVLGVQVAKYKEVFQGTVAAVARLLSCSC